jgi:hypothetical protein
VTNYQNENGPPGLEFGARPGYHPRTGATDINLTSNLNLADTQQCNGHRAVQCLECGRYLTAKTVSAFISGRCAAGEWPHERR